MDFEASRQTSSMMASVKRPPSKDKRMINVEVEGVEEFKAYDNGTNTLNHSKKSTHSKRSGGKRSSTGAKSGKR